MVLIGSLPTVAAAQYAVGGRPAVAVRPVTTEVGAPQALPRLMERELAGLLGVRLTSVARAAFLLRPSLTRVERGRESGEHSVRCQVSVIVEDRHGAVRLVLSGSARAVGGRNLRDLEEQALLGAIRSALRPLSGALRRGAEPRS